MSLRYLHVMVRVSDLEQSLDFYCNKLGLEEVRRKEVGEGRFTLVFLSAPLDKERAMTHPSCFCGGSAVQRLDS